MQTLYGLVTKGYLRLIEPIAALLIRLGIRPNTITTIGTLCTLVGAGLYAAGHIMAAGWVIGLTALFDVLDGTVARRTGKSTVFGAFYDSTLDRVADGGVMAGLTIFYATSAVHNNIYMVVVCLVGIIGTFLISYTRARAEALGIDAKVGLMQRPERIVLLSAPQAFFGLFWNGWVLMGIIVLLTVTAWITAVQRIACVHRATLEKDSVQIRVLGDTAAPPKAAPMAAPRQAQL